VTLFPKLAFVLFVDKYAAHSLSLLTVTHSLSLTHSLPLAPLSCDLGDEVTKSMAFVHSFGRPSSFVVRRSSSLWSSTFFASFEVRYSLASTPAGRGASRVKLLSVMVATCCRKVIVGSGSRGSGWVVVV